MTAVERYRAMRKEGLSHNLAEMFALQSPPHTAGTDTVFLAGHCNGNQFEKNEHIGNMYRAEAAAAGVDVKGKVYLGGLAAYPGDPEAWVSGTGDVRRVCEQRGWGCRGAVKVRSGEPVEPVPEIPLAPDIVDAEVGKVLERTPNRKHIDVGDLREQVKDKLTPPWHKKKGS